MVVLMKQIVFNLLESQVDTALRRFLQNPFVVSAVLLLQMSFTVGVVTLVVFLGMAQQQIDDLLFISCQMWNKLMPIIK